MKKVIPIFLALLFLTGCGSQPEQEIDPEEMGPRLLEEAGFPETMVPLEAPMLEALYQIDSDRLDSFYGAVSGGATAEELLLLKVSQEEDVQAIYDRLAQHLEDRTESFADYVPEEGEKLDNAILTTVGQTVVLCICGDWETAKTLLEG